MASKKQTNFLSTSLDDFFDSIFCLNPKQRIDCLRKCQIEFTQFGLIVKKIAAFSGIIERIKSFSNMGLDPSSENFSKRFSSRIVSLLSHLKVIKYARLQKLRRILVLEDDFQFLPALQDRFNQNLSQVPQTCSLLYFVGYEKDRLEKN